MVTRQVRSGLLALALCFGTVSVAPPALAQSAADLAKARSLFKQGLSLEAAGDWAGALAKFEDVGKVKLTPQVRFHIGRCKENLGRLNEALGDYRLAEYEANQQNAKEAPEITSAREALEGRIPKLTITRGEGTESARIELDGVELGEAQVGKEISVDPGPHKIVVRLSSKKKFEENVSVGEGESKPVELVVPADLAGAGGSMDDGEISEPPDGPPPDDMGGGNKLKAEPGSPLPWVIGGVGVASLAASGVFFLLSQGAKSDLEDTCKGDVCPERLRDTEDKGKQYTLLTNVTLGIGVVGVGVAVVMLMSQGGGPEQPAASLKPKKKNLRVDVAQGRSFTGVNVVGSF